MLIEHGRIIKLDVRVADLECQLAEAQGRLETLHALTLEMMGYIVAIEATGKGTNATRRFLEGKWPPLGAEVYTPEYILARILKEE